jgi:hypothetical protein
MRHPLIGIIHDHRKLVGPNIIRAAYHEVAHGLPHILLHRA